MGKPQVRASENDPARPVARWVGPANMDPETAAELAETAADMQRARDRASKQSNKLCRFMNETFYRVDKTWPWLKWSVTGEQMKVRFFFPTKNLAIDQFANPTDWDRKQVEAKRRLFKEHGIKYFPMFPENKLMELADYL